MRSLLGRFHRPFARGVMNNTLLTNNLGDGSTLSLDFTTGVLDPRLTFSRTSNATFINSSGYVEWANANMYWNTAFEGLSGSNPSLTSSGWGYALSTGGAAVFNGDGSVTVTTTAAERRAIFRSSGFSGGGLRVVASVDVTIHSGSLQASQVIVTGTPSNAQHYVDGVIWNSSHPNWNGGILPVGTQFNISYATDSQTSGTTSMYFGVGCSSTIAGSATFSNPRWTMWKGSGTVPYYPNTSVTNNVPVNTFKSGDYQAPRFDYDPTAIGTPRGLLIEGTSINYVLRSDVTGFPSPWSTAGTNLPTVTAGYSGGGFSPDGSTYPTRLQFGVNSGGSASRILQATSYATNPTTANPYTVSVWMKSNTAGTNYTINIYGTTGNNLVTVTPTWQRFQVVNTSGTSLVGYIYISNESTSVAADVSIWGVQLEAGSGASSYIPTGASTAQRLADSLLMTGAGLSWFSNSYAEGTFLFRGAITNTPTGYTRLFCLTQSASISTATGTVPAFNVGVAASNSNRPFMNAFVSANNDVDIYVPVGAAVTNGTEFGLAAAYKASDWRISSKNLAATSTFGSVGTTWGVNLFMNNINGVPMPQVWYKQFRFYPTRLPNAQMDLLSA